MTQVLVTGATGFIGTHLCRRLADSPHDVSAVDVERGRVDLPGSVAFHERDLRTAETLPEADVIVHLAAHSQVQPVVESPELAVENVEMTSTVLEAAAEMDASVVNVSSRDVYGSAIRPNERAVTLDSPNAYAASKVAGEALGNAFTRTHDIPVTSLRLANVYGPRDLNHRVIPIFVALGAAGRQLTVHGEGKLLDFVHVEDTVTALVRAIERVSALRGEAVNVGSGTGITLADLAEMLTDRIESCPGWTVEENRTGDVDRYVSDVSKADAALDFRPTVDIEDGLDGTVEWYLDHERVLEEIRAGI